jgi:hypothetical protein
MCGVILGLPTILPAYSIPTTTAITVSAGALTYLAVLCVFFPRRLQKVNELIRQIRR